MLYGYGGRILRIDLSNNRASVEALGEDFARQYIGGRGFVARLLYDEVPPGADPLGEENRLVVAAGPLSGTFLPSSSKVEFGAKSPATGGYADSNMGGHFSAELKMAGYDAIVIGGRSPDPCYLLIEDDKIEVRSAGHLWGRGALETEKLLKDELGHEFQIATIGPAGENLVGIACISHDFGRQAGRGGMGAVMGSKNLKAIAVRGTRGFPIADPDGVLDFGKKMYRGVFAKPGFREWTPYGTADITDWVNEVGSFPTRNFKTGYFEKHKQINGKALRGSIVVLDKGCFACPIPCGKYSRTSHRGHEVYVEGPEYETIALLGGNCLLERIEEIAYANYIFDELGMDTISGGGIVAFAMECFEKGILAASDTDGREIRFGDLDSVVLLARMIAERRGIGDLLSRGVKVAAAELGRGSEKFAIHVKGLEVSGYEPRYAAATLLSYMTCDVGAHHNRSWAITYDAAVGRDKIEGKAQKVIDLQHVRPLLDTLGVCRFPWIELGFELEHYARIYPLVTGQNTTWEELLEISERIWNLTRAFWVREVPGFGRAWDAPPPRFYEEAVESGPTAGKVLPRETIDALLSEYYQLRGWDQDGVPTPEKLEELGLGSVAADLKKVRLKEVG